jgi:hypothetical protein
MDNNDSSYLLAFPTIVQVMIMGMLGRADRENLARTSEKLRDILNNTSSLNRWITEETRRDLEDRAWWLQGLSDGYILTDLCRYPGCPGSFVVPLDAGPGGEDFFFFKHELHMQLEHPEMWDLLDGNLKQNKLPYLKP